MKKILEQLAALGFETNAAMSSTDGTGGDAIPVEVLSSQIMDLMPGESTFLPLLPGDQNKELKRKLNEVESVNIVGEIPQFRKGETEQVDGFTTPQAANATVPTGKVTITQKRYELTFDITKKLQTYSVVDFEEWIKKEAANAMAKTLDNVLLNGDIVTAATGNINSVDGAPAATENYLQQDGIRKWGLANNGVNLGALSFQDYIDMLIQMGAYASDPSQLLWILNNETYLKSMGIEQFQDASKNGKSSIIHDGSKALTNILGADLMVSRRYSKANATGKVSTTPANNTTGALSCLWLPGIQYGFGEEFDMQVFNLGSRGIKLNMWFDFGFAIADPSDVGIDDGKTIVSGYNATLV